MRTYPLHDTLLENIKKNLPALEKELEHVENEWAGEDLFYRYYHQSFKAYHVQDYTSFIVLQLQSLMPGRELNEDFMKIIKEGTGKTFQSEHNQRWDQEVRPLLEAFFHAREMLRFVVKYGKLLDKAPDLLPSGWAAVLYLYNLR